MVLDRALSAQLHENALLRRAISVGLCVAMSGKSGV